MSISTSISTNRSMPRESALCTAHAQAKASCLQLPQLRLQGPLACFQDACLLVVGGRAPEAAWLREAAKGREVWAVDHGLDACLAADIRPQRLIGDGDSAAPAAWQLAKEQHIPIEQFPVEKDDTDTQLALKLAREAGFPAAIVTGAFGGRFDHALSTVTSCAFAPLPCLLADERETLLFVHGSETLRCCPPRRRRPSPCCPSCRAARASISRARTGRSQMPHWKRAACAPSAMCSSRAAHR